ncbi:MULTISPECIES: hypothetical protein [unclassified Ensifer]|uniref:hypothetical protein n=1 Tax=unclassified Ensifer TaxID=2633371 RepID=UPI00070A050B|nr:MULTISPECIES: hypothetical protein [unclassified Ensifer]KQW47212.1 hypothetical protein ASD02_34475 [Ensifer sp. Root1252]KRC68764.1 hypothetical protein ASE32_35305 [Ensifer sp. Root231]KRC93930.1 hypothetical protein ASE47_34970 [Ensifer sp. Root258]
MRLVFVHGMRQEGKEPSSLLSEWSDALFKAWKKLDLHALNVRPEMPFYGDELDRLTQEGGSALTIRLRGGEGLDPDEADLLKEIAAANGISESDVRREAGVQVLERGPLNWDATQALVRLLETKVPAFGRFGLKFVVQVNAYLRRPNVTEAVDGIVAPFLAGDPAVVVGHSLGSVVSYRLLTRLGTPNVPLFMTLGSPLGFGTVKEYLKPPKLARPGQVGAWINGTDDRDYVATFSSLDAKTFCDGIENWIDIKNRQEDAHSIVDYLSNEKVARSLHDALK